MDNESKTSSGYDDEKDSDDDDRDISQQPIVELISNVNGKADTNVSATSEDENYNDTFETDLVSLKEERIKLS